MARRNWTGNRDPVVKVGLLDSMGAIYNSLGSSDKAKLMLDQSLNLRRARLPGDRAGMANTLASLADVETNLSHDDKAIALSQQAIAGYRQRFGGNDERIALRLAQISTDYWELDNTGQSEAYEREALALSSRLVGRHDPRTLTMIGDFGTILGLEGKTLEAEPYYREYLDAAQALSPPNLPAVGDGLLWLGVNHYRLGRFGEAEEELRRCLALRLQAYAGEHPATAQTQAALALILLSRGKVSEALDLSNEAVDADQKLFGPTHRETAYAEDALGLALLAGGRTLEAHQAFDSDLKARIPVFPPTHIQIARTWMFLAMADLARDEMAAAAEECRKGLDILDRAYGKNAHPQQAELDAVMIEILTAQRQYKQAEEFGAPSEASFRRSLPRGNPRLAAIESALGWALLGEGKFDQAARLLREALAIDEQTYGTALAQTAQVGIRLAECLQDLGRDAEAGALIRKYRAVLLASPDGTYRAEHLWLAAHGTQGGDRMEN
jgi:tetratricopeptide (TPR) repeat protein